MNLVLSKQAQKFLSSLEKKIQKQLVAKLLLLRENSYPADSKKLKNSHYHRCDSGEYRIIYSVQEESLLIVLVGKRNDDEIYRLLKRKRD